MGIRCLSRTGRCSCRFRKGMRIATWTGHSKRSRPVSPLSFCFAAGHCQRTGDQLAPGAFWSAALSSTSTKGRATLAGGPLGVSGLCSETHHPVYMVGPLTEFTLDHNPEEETHSTPRPAHKHVHRYKHTTTMHSTKHCSPYNMRCILTCIYLLYIFKCWSLN